MLSTDRNHPCWIEAGPNGFSIQNLDGSEITYCGWSVLDSTEDGFTLYASELGIQWGWNAIEVHPAGPDVEAWFAILRDARVRNSWGGIPNLTPPPELTPGPPERTTPRPRQPRSSNPPQRTVIDREKREDSSAAIQKEWADAQKAWNGIVLTIALCVIALGVTTLLLVLATT